MEIDHIVEPSQPRIVHEEENQAMFEIDGLYPGYGYTLGNSLRRIILSSLPGSTITSVAIKGVQHEFSTLEGVKEDVIEILLNLKRIRLHIEGNEPQKLRLSIKGPKKVTAGDIEVPGGVEVLSKDLPIAEITGKGTELSMEITAQRGLGYVSKEMLQKDKVEIGHIALDANFSPIRRVNYEVENMRVGDRTDFHRLRIFIETDGTLSPREVLESSISIMIRQLKAIVGFQEEEEEEVVIESDEKSEGEDAVADTELLKTRIETLGLSTRTENALIADNVRTLGGLVSKTEDDILAIEGLGKKGIEEIKDALKERGVSLKEA